MKRAGILLAIDSGAAATAAVEATAFIAHALRTRVAVLYVDHTTSASEANPSPDRRAVEQLRRAGVEAEVEVRAGDPADETLAASRGLHVQLIVMGSRGRSTLTGLLLGSVSQAVSARATCPVLVVRPGNHAWPVRRILLAIEGAAGSSSLAATTARLATAMNAEVVVTHVSYPGGEQVERGLYHARQTHGEEATSAVIQRLARRGIHATALPVVAVNGISRALARCAESVDAQLIVMGAHEPARSGEPAGTELSTSVLHRSRRPVLVIREGEAE